MAKQKKKDSKNASKKAASGRKAIKNQATKKTAKRKSARKQSAAFMKPLALSASLAAVIGSEPLPRTEIVKRIWDYIKENNLQDLQNKRMINADAKLKPVFGGKSKISMFEIAKEVNKHVQSGPIKPPQSET